MERERGGGEGAKQQTNYILLRILMEEEFYLTSEGVSLARHRY